VETKKRRSARHEILANFQFYIDERSKEIFAGITLNVSPEGFGFLTETSVQQGQIITITKHALPDLSGQKAKILWVKKGSHYLEAGSEVSFAEVR